MTSEDQQPEPEPVNQLVDLILTSPLRKDPFNIKISKQESINSIKQYLIGLGQLVQPLTCFSLRFGDLVLDPFLLVGEYSLESGNTLHIVPENYSFSESIFHVQQTRELLGLTSDSNALPAINAGSLNLLNFKTEKRKPKSKKPVSASDKPEFAEDHPIFDVVPGKVLDVLPELQISNANKSTPAASARALQLSPWNPVNSRNKLEGHLLYLKFVTQDSKVHHITGHRNGFTVNSSTDEKFDARPKKGGAQDVSLVQLIGQISPMTINLVERSNNQLAKISPLAWIRPKNARLSTPWVVNDTTTPQPDLARSQLALNEQQALKDWNDDYQSTRELPTTDEEGNSSVRDRLVREKLLYSVNHDFSVAATKGAIDIVEGNLQALNPGEPVDSQIFLRNGIFYTIGSDSVGIYNELGGDDAARVAVNKDLRGVEQIMQLDLEGLSPVLTTIVDYCGRRIVAQGPVPGVFRESAETQIAYGSTEGREQILADETFAQDMKRIAEYFHMKEHASFDTQGNAVDLLTSVDTKGMVGTDGRRYVLDLARVTPTDVGFLEANTEPAYPHKFALLRPEAIAEWFRSKVQKELEAEDKDQKLSEERINELNNKYRLNPDVFITEEEVPEAHRAQYAEDRKAVLEVSELIVKELIPRFISELRASSTVYPIDGVQLTQVLHRRGINLRYFGALYAQAEGSIFDNLRLVIAQEAIVRSVKHLLNNIIRSLPLIEGRQAIAEYLSTLVEGSDAEQLQTVEAEVLRRFRITLPESWKADHLSRPSLLRDISLALGLQWDSQHLREVFSSASETKLQTSGLLSICPKVRYASSKSLIAEEALEAGRVSIHNGDIEVGLDLVSESLSLHEQVYGNLHAETARAYNQVSLLYHEQKDYEKAVEHSRKAILIAERILGIDSCETIVMYINLAFFERARGNLSTALELSKHVYSIWGAIGFPDHPDMGTTLDTVALILQQARHYKGSLPWFEKATEIFERSYGAESSQIASISFELSQSQLMVGDYPAATRSMEKSFSIYKHLRGPEDENTVETKKWLDKLLSATVKDLRATKMLETRVIEPKLAAPKKDASTPKLSGRSVNDIVNYIMGDEKTKGKKSKKSKN